MYLVLATASGNRSADAGPSPAADLLSLDAAGNPSGTRLTVALQNLPDVVRGLEQDRPRWVWQRTQDWYPALLRAGVSVEKCHDLTLCRNILVYSEFTASTGYPRANMALPVEGASDSRPGVPNQDSLFDSQVQQRGPGLEELCADLRAQLAAVRDTGEQAKLSLLLAAESAGTLIAAEMQHTGVPWREDLHEAILQTHLGPRPEGMRRPEQLERLAARLRDLLGVPGLNPDSGQELLRALHRSGVEVKTTRSWELEQLKHPAIEPLLAYKKLSRLFAANGWAWLDQWVAGGRFRPEYVVGGVVSGRWASRGGGALQIPRQIRGAAFADSGYKLIVADAAQLEPRVLAALARDTKMAEAARDKDLYAGIAAQGFGGDRAKAKVALLGAIYGATTGESGRLMPQLTRTYPQAVGYVEDAARAGEKGRIVTTRLGRSCPPPSTAWMAAQRSTTAEEQRRADGAARSRGRFTRNFVVQGSAADWAACWMAELRRRLRAFPSEVPGGAAADGGPAGVPEMVFFLHDEIMVHARDEDVDRVCALLEEAARAATQLLFGQIPIEFPVNITVVQSYADAK
ncbi:bifunctional 3'-5' exonuclease/DNA polymerase [Paenarthrobacter sp. Z7-10]|uniref:bifunctional 3'-5' exonuclease/DNA polymerase n=1 Tax=Paenarthrobacter sp. Z7-10 TaxID=2787635 RepID=UPI0022A94C4F|nr:bifunctional 3'-5' exonuclease/DNA polymerase [Paenarthrobacter sp. Z7-10]MCZ2401803.1 bifunctional 3'-5' exonuclease/DNA polymerase [Paenarthrobacter sp. Z7-10]